MSQTDLMWQGLPPVAAALAALGMAGFLILRRTASPVYRSLGALVATIGVFQGAMGLALLDGADAILWRHLALVGELLQPAALLYFGLSLFQEKGGTASSRTLNSARWRARVVLVLGVVMAVVTRIQPNMAGSDPEGQLGAIAVSPQGRILYVFTLVGLVVGLGQLEQLLRVLRDPARYQLKFILIGVGAGAGYHIYQASQVLLLGVLWPEGAWVAALATIMALGLVAVGLRRMGPQPAGGTIYVSPQVAYGSFTFLAVGLYLVGVGLVGEWLRYTGLPITEALRVLLLFVAAVGLTLLAASRSVRTEVRQFIGRNFYRSLYDYRAKWLEVTEAFRTTASTEALLDQTLHVLSRTFGASMISIWMRCEADGRFHRVRSVNTDMAPPPLETNHPVVTCLETADEPVELAGLGETQGESASLLSTTQAVLGVPIRAGSQLLAFVLLSRDSHRKRYGTDDCDLLRAIAHHVGVLLSHAKLADERRAAAGVEALNQLSAFCIHDLKNLAARLSLVVQNAQVYGKDPAFQMSAMRAMAKTVDKMMALIAKLSPGEGDGGTKLESPAECVDVASVVSETVGAVEAGSRVQVVSGGERIPPVRFGREQLSQVLTNLLLNAMQAVGEQGEVRISTQQVDHSVVITVADDGPGIPAGGLQNLFRPFQTTKAGGLGLGLYQCKRTVEAYQGTISVHSVVGRGTEVRIQLPAVEEHAIAR